MHAQLSLDQAPSIETPLRFFTSAPVFLVIAGLIMLVSGPELYSSRWNNSLLALTHSITLGFISTCMIGALFQILPVVAGSVIRHSSRLSLFVYSLYTAGVIALLAGFLMASSSAFKSAILLLGVSLGIFLLSVISSLYQNSSTLASARGIRLALLSFSIAICIALSLVAAYAWPTLPLLRQYTELHIIWAALGWILLSIISVAYQAVPMFQITTEFPALIQKYLAPLIFINLVLYSLFHVIELNILDNIGTIISILFLSLALLAFILASFKLIHQRKKQMPDISLWFWVAGLASLCISIVLYLLMIANILNADILLGIIFLYGSVISIITGMLIKIIPFLVWFHLHRELSSHGKLSDIPLMTDIINFRNSRRLFFLFTLSLLSLCLGTWFPGTFFYLSGLLVLLFGLSLFATTLYAIRIYRRHQL